MICPLLSTVKWITVAHVLITIFPFCQQNDGGGPVICPLLSTGEWITVALADGVGFPCATGELVSANRFYSLLPGTAAFTALQRYRRNNTMTSTMMMGQLTGGAGSD